MNPILLLSGIPTSLQAEIQSRCNEVIPGVSLLFLRSLDDTSIYLRMEAPYEERDYPAPHFMILYVEASQFDSANLHELKKVPEFSKIPIILLAEGVEKAKLKNAFEWLYASIVQVPTEVQDKADLIVETAQYWSGIVKLPLI